MSHPVSAPGPPGVLGSPLISLLFWILICFSIAALFTKRYSIRPLIVALILRSIYYLGIGPTLNILGALNVSAKGPQPPPLRVHHVVGPEAGPLPPTGHCSPHPSVPEPESLQTRGWDHSVFSILLDNSGQQTVGVSQPGATLGHRLQGCRVPGVSCALPEGTLRTSKIYVL